MLILDKSPILRGTNYLSYPDAADIVPAGDFTLELFRVTFTATTASILWSHYNATGNQRSQLLDYSGTAIRYSGSTNGSTLVTLSHTWTPATDGTEYELAVDRSGSTIRLYLDGTMVDSDTISGAFFNSSSVLLIGAGISGSTISAPFPGTAMALRYNQGHAYWATDTSYTVPTLPLPTS